MAESSCGLCRRVFTSVTAFDQHLDVDYSRSQAVKCLEPQSRGLVQRGGKWSLPGPDAWRALRARRPRARAAARA